MTSRAPSVLAVAFALVLVGGPAVAVTGDLNRDGVVNYDDFFILAENWGLRGAPAPETRIDTVRITVWDTVYVALDNTLQTEVHERSGYGWTTSWGRVQTTSSWRFLSYRSTETGVTVSGTFSVTWSNTTDTDLATYYHPMFYDRNDFKIAEYYYTGPTGVKVVNYPSPLVVAIPAGGERTTSEPFAIDLPSLAVANTIEVMGLSAHGWQGTETPPADEPLTVGETASAARPSPGPGVTTIQIEVTNSGTSRATDVLLVLLGRTAAGASISTTTVSVGTLAPGATELVSASFTGTYDAAFRGPYLFSVDYILRYAEGSNITGTIAVDR